MREAVAVGLSAGVLLAVPTLGRALGSPDLVTLATQAVIFGLAAASLDLLIGYTGLISFGHAAFFGLGGYVVAILAVNAADGVAPGLREAWAVWPLAMAVGALAGGISSMMVFVLMAVVLLARPRGLFPAHA